jgi:uncharacterized membrane protein YidH (DUF202 family)
VRFRTTFRRVVNESAKSTLLPTSQAHSAAAPTRFVVPPGGHTSRTKRVESTGEVRQMITLAVVLLISAVVMIVLGLILYGNGVGAVPDDVGRDPVAARRGLTRISWSELFARMRTSTRGMTDKEAGREQKLTALGSFLVMVGLIVLVLAVLAVIAGLA